METLQIVFQILTVAVTIIAIFQKEKWKIMFLHAVNNALCVVMFFVFSRTAAALICAVAVIKNLLYMYYALRKLKPNPLFFFLFGISYIIIAALTWQDAYDILPLIAMLAGNLGGWQDNQTTLRVCYIVNNSSYFAYKLIIGAYIAMAFEALNLVCTTFSFVYYCLLKKETPILATIFKTKHKTKNVDRENVIDESKADTK